jgi:2-oxoglutarate ferredoxin oxidoreductase subunit beta
VDRPAYDVLMAEQLEEAVAQQGRGDLSDLLMGGDTWRIG